MSKQRRVRTGILYFSILGILSILGIVVLEGAKTKENPTEWLSYN